jgi:transcriptional regulator
MYVPSPFRQDDLPTLHDLIRTYSFGLLVTAGPDGPFASHIPFLLDAGAGQFGTLHGHLARPNPQWRHFESGAELLVVFQGPHGYISPTWYERRGANVPTWNYAAVHVHGRPRIVDEPHALDRLLSGLADTYETGSPAPWHLDELPPAQLAALRRGIVAFELPISRIEGKFKLSQNKTQGDRSGAIAALRDRGDAESMALAALMEGKP